jgi:hypothetical protein
MGNAVVLAVKSCTANRSTLALQEARMAMKHQSVPSVSRLGGPYRA